MSILNMIWRYGLGTLAILVIFPVGMLLTIFQVIHDGIIIIWWEFKLVLRVLLWIWNVDKSKLTHGMVNDTEKSVTKLTCTTRTMVQLTKDFIHRVKE